MIKALALVSKPIGISPGQRFRLEQWAPILRHEHEIDFEFLPFESSELTDVLYKPGHRFRKAALVLADFLRRRAALTKAPNYDVVVIYREASLLGPAFYERLIARMRLPIVFDFDDALWLPSHGSANGAFSRLRFPGKTRTLCRLASAVVVGNEYLARYARRHNKNVTVIPSTVNLAESPLQPIFPDTKPFTVVWSGSHSSLDFLKVVAKPLERIGRDREVVLRLICSRPPSFPLPKVTLEFVPWSAEEEAARLAPAHVGIMPLTDDPFTRGKSGLKLLQYMAIGLPVVATPVGANADIVQDGVNGLWARSPEEWGRALLKLAESPSLRAELGRRGRQTVEERYTAERGATQLKDVLTEVTRTRP